ncbi:hypothetical protein GIB67_033952 [Kingdonia uniflora]|uniref:Squalene epoxidase domain-containing protein n=1 Tax=Kingdonia uniflora TaxID=39325 RepID=A0A7J7L6U1_9MAGN|nr:hypothetical protein GIB67_033952 [Kingdonia uniflora]
MYLDKEYCLLLTAKWLTTLRIAVASQVPPQLYDSYIATIDKGSIKIMQNRSMPADPHPTPGALLMGDAFNMYHPLTGRGMTVALSDIAVGAQTEAELKEKKLRVEDALNATKAAVEDGIVVGGGCTLLRLAVKVDAIKLTLNNDEQKVRADIVKRALSYPLKLSVVMEKVYEYTSTHISITLVMLKNVIYINCDVNCQILIWAVSYLT